MAASSLHTLLPVRPSFHGLSISSPSHLTLHTVPMACSSSTDPLPSPPPPSLPMPFRHAASSPSKSPHIPLAAALTSRITSPILSRNFTENLNDSKASTNIESVAADTNARELEILVNGENGKEGKWVTICAEPLTRAAFEPFGEVLETLPEDAPVGEGDATPQLTQGTPRLYVMRLRNRPLRFQRLTHHAAVTQTLGSIGSGGEPWYLAVSAPTLLRKGEASASAIQSRAGHFFLPPPLSSVRVFRIESQQMVSLHVATWHQGPFFRPHTMDFYNLELSNTGEVDHTCRGFNGVNVEILDD